jgi:hypothetical protein
MLAPWFFGYARVELDVPRSERTQRRSPTRASAVARARRPPPAAHRSKAALARRTFSAPFRQTPAARTSAGRYVAQRAHAIRTDTSSMASKRRAIGRPAHRAPGPAALYRGRPRCLTRMRDIALLRCAGVTSRRASLRRYAKGLANAARPPGRRQRRRDDGDAVTLDERAAMPRSRASRAHVRRSSMKRLRRHHEFLSMTTLRPRIARNTPRPRSARVRERATRRRSERRVARPKDPKVHSRNLLGIWPSLLARRTPPSKSGEFQSGTRAQAKSSRSSFLRGEARTGIDR